MMLAFIFAALLLLALHSCQRLPRVVREDVEADFIARLRHFRLALCPSSPPDSFRSTSTPLPSFPISQGWRETECGTLGIRVKFERLLTPDHARSTLQLVRASGSGVSDKRYVRKIHGSPKAYQAEADFYRRVRHHLVSAVLCWDRGDTESYKASLSAKSVKEQEMAKMNNKGLLMDYVGGGQSGDWIYELGYRASANTAYLVFQRLVGQLVDVLEYVHATGMVHGDLKPENILINHSASSALSSLPRNANEQEVDTWMKSTGLTVRLIDFDLSAPADSPRVRSGTRTTMSPEIALIIKGPLNEASDWWSAGATVLLWAAALRCGEEEATGRGGQAGRLCNYRPFLFIRQEGEMEIRPLPGDLRLPDGLRRFLYLLLDPSPSKRRFISTPDLEFLRRQLGLQQRLYDDHKSAVEQSSSISVANSENGVSDSDDSIHSSLSDTRSPSNRSERRSALQEKADYPQSEDDDECSEEECVKRERRPMINRRFYNPVQ